MRDTKVTLLIDDGDQLERWEEHSTTILNRVTSGEIPPFMDDMLSQSNMRIRIGSPNRNEAICAIKPPALAVRLEN